MCLYGKGDPMALPEQLVVLLRKPAVCYVSTTMPDGSPKITQTSVDTDGEHVVINVVRGMQKDAEPRARPLARPSRIGPGGAEPVLPGTRPSSRCDRCWRGGLDRGPVAKVHRPPYAWYRGRDQVRLVVNDRGAARSSGVH